MASMCENAPVRSSRSTRAPVMNFPKSFIGSDVVNGTLRFVPNQKRVPIILTDHARLPSHPLWITLCKPNATMETISLFLKERLFYLREICPVKVFYVIVVGGGENITSAMLQYYRHSSDDLVETLFETITQLDNYCMDHGDIITFGHVIPRPCEMDNHVSLNAPPVRRELSRIYLHVNNFISRLNHANRRPALILDKFFEFTRVFGVATHYPGTRQNLIRRIRFDRRDYRTLSENGLSKLHMALRRLVNTPEYLQ